MCSICLTKARVGGRTGGGYHSWCISQHRQRNVAVSECPPAQDCCAADISRLNCSDTTFCLKAVFHSIEVVDLVATTAVFSLVSVVTVGSHRPCSFLHISNNCIYLFIYLFCSISRYMKLYKEA